jgi:hypothetical protein
MSSIEVHLRAHLKSIEPTAAQKKRAQVAEQRVRADLTSGNLGARVLGTYLTGSYSRNTALRPLDDVDIVVEVDPAQWPKRGLGAWWSGLPRPDDVLKRTADAVRYRYRKAGGNPEHRPTKVRQQRCSVGVMLSDLHIDLVLAVPDSSDQDLLRLPDRHAGRWFVSRPRVHKSLVSSLNSQHAGKFVPVVKLLKRWNAGLPATAKMKGFVVETMAYYVFSEVGITTYQDALFDFFDFLVDVPHGHPVDLQRSLMLDIAETGSNLLDGVDSERVRRFVTHAGSARTALIQAEEARTATSGWTIAKKQLARPLRARRGR